MCGSSQLPGCSKGFCDLKTSLSLLKKKKTSRRKLHRELQVTKLAVIYKNQEAKRVILKDDSSFPGEQQ